MNNILDNFNVLDFYKVSTKNKELPIKTRKFDDADKLTKQEKTIQGVYEWTQYFRKYPAELAKIYGVNLYPFQEYILTMWFRNNNGMYLASRGQGKTFLIAVFCILKMILYPNTKIVVCAGAKSQAMKIVAEKIPEICMNKEILLREFSFYPPKTSISLTSPNIEFKNGSTLSIVAANENARSCRANVLILDEFRQIKKEIYEGTLRRFMSNERITGYRHKSEWSNYPLERNQEFFLTSCYFKFNWWYEKYKTFLSSMLRKKKYFLAAFPYQMAIKHKLLNPDAIKEEIEEGDFNPTVFQMEMQCLPYGQTENAYFQGSELDLLRTLNYPIYPREYYVPSVLDDKKFKFTEKKDGEIRLLCCDVATQKGKINDASSFILLRLTRDKHGYIRRVPYLTSVEGGHTTAQALMIKRLFYLLDCDYIVLDRQGAGVGIYDSLVLPTYDGENNETYEPMCSCNEPEQAERCPYPNPLEVIYTIAASEAFNDEIARELKDIIRKRRLELLGDKDSMVDYFEHFPNYYTKTSSENKKLLAGVYEETESLINEMVLLEATYGNTANEYLRLRTTGRNRKDRYTALAYGNHIAKILEQKVLIPDENVSMLDMIKAINGSRTGNKNSGAGGLSVKIY